MTCPVMKLDEDDKANNTASAISVAYAILPRGILDDRLAANFSRSSLLPVAFVSPRDKGVSVTPMVTLIGA
jgi:hypothetical protein